MRALWVFAPMSQALIIEAAGALAIVYTATRPGLPGQSMYLRMAEVQSLMLLQCGPRIVVGLLVELVGDPLLSPRA